MHRHVSISASVNHQPFPFQIFMTTPSPKDDSPPSSTEQPFIEHLLELHTRLIRCALGVLAATVALAIYPGPARLLDFLAQPIRAHLPANTRLIAVDVFSPFLVPMKVLLLVGLIAAMPWVIYQVWAFVAPGLYRHEKQLALPLIIAGSLLAYAGIAFVQFLVLDRLFAFIQAFSPDAIAATPDIASYVQTLLSMYLAFALAFQVPIVVILLVRFGIVPLAKLQAFRGYFIIVAFIIAAIATPPDVFSQLALAIPMCLLYEVGLLAARFFLKIKPGEEENLPTTEKHP